MRISLATTALIGLAVLAALELALRAMVTLPIYDADAEIGYIPRANQAGRLLGRPAWNFDEIHLLGDHFVPTPGAKLVMGDSVVWGRNRITAAERVGAQLERATGSKVWSAAADGWSLRNELAYLRRFPAAAAGVSEVVFVLNSEDFADAASWWCEWMQPTSAPASVAYFLARKHAAPSCAGTPPDLKVPPGDWRPELRAFLQTLGSKPVRVFLYPMAGEVGDASKRAKLLARAQELKAAGVGAVFDVAADSRWRRDFYEDHIHPGAAGNAALAAIIAAPQPQTRL